MRNFGLEEGLIQTIEALYNSSSSAVLLNNQIGQPFKTTVGVRQSCLLSPTLFNLFLEQIMREALQDFHSTISIGGRPISNLRFVDDIDLMGGSNEELQDLTTRLTNRASAYGMEVSTEKSKVMVNTLDDTTAQIYMNGEKLEEVSSFKYLGATLTKDGRSLKEIKIRIAMATQAMAKLSKIWKSKEISFPTKIKIYKAIVLSTMLYGCESWTLNVDSMTKIQTFENKCLRRLLGISWKDHRTNESVKDQIRLMAGRQEPLLTTVKKRKLKWYGHITRHNSLSKTILQGTIEGGRRRGRQRKCWLDNIKEWTRLDSPTLLRKAEDRDGWRRLAESSSVMSPLRPSGQETE